MSDRHAGYLVTLAEDVKDEDAQAIIAALGMVKGVLKVRPVVANPMTYIGRDRADVEWRERIHALLNEK
jgi:hypothetical protein